MEGLVFTVLVVDDEPNIRLGAERILKGTGFEVVTAESGEKGLEVLTSTSCHILLLDLMMPGMGGMEVLKRVAVSHPEVVVIVITGYATLETAVEAMKWGAYDFIPKPFQPDSLRIVVSRAAEKLRLKEEHKRLAEERLQSLRAIDLEKTRTRAIVQSMSEGVVLSDSNGRVILCNPAAQRFLSLDQTPIPSSTVEACIPEPSLRELVQQVCCEKDAVSEQVCTQELLLDDGTWLLAKVSPVITGAGDDTGALTVLSDITTQKSLAEMKSEFVAKVSHELRSPLASINQTLSVVISDLEGDEHDEDRRRLNRVRDRTRGLLDLIADLLDVSRLELGTNERACEEVDPVAVLAHTIESCAHKLEEKHLTLAVQLPEDQALCMQADPRELESVYENLLSNAIKYTPDGGHIAVEGTIDHGALCVAFRDSGIGIAREELPRIFEKFYRVKSHETRMIVGTGLGLPIVKSIIDAHGGVIDVDSEPGKGTTFTVKLPLAPKE